MNSLNINLSNGAVLCLSITSKRSLLLSPGNSDYEILDESGKLLSLNCNNEFKVERGTVLTLNKQKYKIDLVEREVNNLGKTTGYNLRIHKKVSKSSNFLAPMLGENRLFWRWNIDFVNCFCGTEADGDYGNSIYMLYKFNGHLNWMTFEAEVMKLPFYAETIDTDPYHVLFRFDIPEKFKHDAELILRGQYSKISDTLKQQILKFHGATKDRPLGHILYKDPTRRVELEKQISGALGNVSLPKEAELLDCFYPEEEIFMNRYIIQETDYGTYEETSGAF